MLLRDIFKNETVDANSIDIIKRELGETPPTGYHELEKGYIRGLYVQYILDNPNSEKTIPELLSIAWHNKNVWLGNMRGDITPSTEVKSLITPSDNIEEEQSILPYPNPVENVLYFGTTIDKVSVYTLNGTLINTAYNVSNLSFQGVNSGFCIVTTTINEKTTIHKVIKK